MKRVGLWAAIGIGLVISVGFIAVEHGSAQAKKRALTCSLATLNGRYLFADAGTALPPAFGVTEPTVAADAGFHIFNGDGTGTDTVTVRLNGVIVLENVVVPTSYTVNADCTGAITVNVPGGGGPTFSIFIAPDGEAMSVIATNPGNYPSRIVQRVSKN